MSKSKRQKNRRIVILCSAVIILSVAASVVIAVNGTKALRKDTATSSNDSVSAVTENAATDNLETFSSSVSVSSQQESEPGKAQTTVNGFTKQGSSEPVKDGEKICYLTFDDGPSTKITSSVLATLDKYDVKATFFVVGTGSTKMLSEIANAGHTIGLHSATHEWDIYDSEEDFFNDLESISDKVYKETGIKSNIIRFPGGSSNTVSKKHCTGIMTKLAKDVEAKGYIYIDWNVSSGDAASKPITKSAIVNNVLKQAKKSDGTPKDEICVLMHDLGTKASTAEALPEIIEGLREMGYSFRSISNDTNGFHQPIAN